MGEMKLTIGYLYPSVLSQYGDGGNVLCLQQRCRWRGIDVEVRALDIGVGLAPEDIDLFFMGGGADFQQRLIMHDLTDVKGEALRTATNQSHDGPRPFPTSASCNGASNE